MTRISMQAWMGCLFATLVFGCAAGSSDEGGNGANASASGGQGGVAFVPTGGSGGSGGSGGGEDCLASEICDDGIDNDCNGDIDDCNCEPGTSEECYAGPADAAGVGVCLQGMRYCAGKEFATWGPCDGWVPPGIEICDADLLDDDCDGVANEGCECAEGEVIPCGTDVGECVAGTQSCVNGTLGPCVGQVGTAPEVCNNLDDDCDGNVDEGLTDSCGSDVGACTPGSTTCSAGQWGPCLGAEGPFSETCNGVDDDCDGQTDESLTQACGTDVGICVEGTQTCSGGQWGSCSGVGPGAESCNGLDDDCDGQLDEVCTCQNGQTQTCGTDVGVCVAGLQSCVNGQWAPTCVGETGPGTETCNNLDDDCDGQTDENLTQSCGTNVGACQAGTMTCSAGQWGSCQGAIGPTTETCNNADDDCDGFEDENLSQQCGITDVGVCQYGTSNCSNGQWGSCQGAINPQPEVCGNGLDDDCDGQIDELSDCPDDPPTCVCPLSPINANVLDTVTLAASCSDPDGGAVTYLWDVTAAPAGSSSQPTPPNAATTNFFLDLAGDYTITLYVTDDEGNTVVGCQIDITAAAPQDIHVELVWDEAWGDADLHMTQANITPGWFISETDCFFGNPSAAWPPNGPAGNASLDLDDTDGYGPENINIDNQPQSGTYNIGVAYYCSHSIRQQGDPPVNPGDGPATATVNVYCGGNLVATYPNIDLDRTGRFVHVATITWPSCAGASVSDEDWTTCVQPSAYSSPLHCPLPCSSNNDCGGCEVCGQAIVNNQLGYYCLKQ